jgi:altronate dehydratase
MKKRNAIKLNHKDNVAMCITELKKGDLVILSDDESFKALNDIPFAHKVSIQNIKCNDDIIKYGYSIGKATSDIIKGQWLHVHNIHGGKRL